MGILLHTKGLTGSCGNNGLPLDFNRLLPAGRKKSVQLVRLRQWAQEQGCWFVDRSLFCFIDIIIYPSDTGGYDLYRSLSPQFSGDSV